MVDMSRHLGFGNLTPKGYGYSLQPQVDMTGVNPSVVEKLGQLQATRSSPLSVSSGYRSPGYNARVGGAKHSQHMRGNAIDIDTSSMTRAEVKSLVATASRLGFNGIGIYDKPGNQSVHFDVREHKAAWGPSRSFASVPGWAADVIGAHLRNEYQGTAPATAVAKVDRQQLPAVGPVPQARPTQTAVATPTAAPRQVAAFTPAQPTAKAPSIGLLSPISSAQAAPAPSMAQSPAAAVMSAPSPSRFGPATTPNIAEANQLKSALQAQAASLAAAPAQAINPDRFGPVAQNVSLNSLRSAVPAAIDTTAPKTAFSPTPASYQTPAFSTAKPQIDAFAQSPMPGIQPAAANPYASYSTLAEAAAAQAAPAPTQMAPALAAPTRTISNPKVASVQIAAPENPAPAPNPSLNQFPDKPKPGLLSGLLNPTTLAGAAIGNMALGPVGGLLGGLLGHTVNNAGGLGGLFSHYNGPTTDVGTGLNAINSVMGGGMPVGSTAFSRSMPGMSVTSLPGGAIQRTNQYGVTQITTADGRTGAARRAGYGGAGGNYGGVKSESARNAIDHGIGGLF